MRAGEATLFAGEVGDPDQPIGSEPHREPGQRNPTEAQQVASGEVDSPRVGLARQKVPDQKRIRASAVATWTQSTVNPRWMKPCRSCEGDR